MMGDEGQNGISFGDKLKSLWHNLPFNAKLTIIGGVAAFMGIFLGAGVLMGLVPDVFLNYSDDAQVTDDLKKEYEEYWTSLCEDDDKNCSEEQLEAAKKLQEDQKKFYEKLNSLEKKYRLSKEQKYIVLTTIFYGLDIDEFITGTGVLDIDDSEEINYEVQAGENMYKREQDSLKELIKQFKVNTAICHYTTTNENGELVEHADPMVNFHNETFTFNFFDKFRIVTGIGIDDEDFKTASEECKRRTSGTVKIEDTTSSKASIDGYYKYLRESSYFDDKPHLVSRFKDYGRNHGLSEDLSSWADEELQVARDDIIEDIKNIVKDHVSETQLATSVGTGNAYWWPIGSRETTSENGVLFAAGDPEATRISSPFGMRKHPISGEYKLHNGIDIPGALGEANIIASLGGTVKYINNSCASTGSNGCGGGFGNYVEIEDTKGNLTIYAHMYQGSLTVAVGDVVSRGQVIGKVGSSGNSTGAHLHFSIKVNGTYQQPLDYVDPDNPRPAGSGTVDFNKSRYTKEEFIAKLNDYYSKAGTCDFSKEQARNGCNSFKSEILNNGGAAKIYDHASSMNLNPELFVTRSYIEGYSPGVSYNYFGYNCTNTGGGKDCRAFTSFEHGVEVFCKNIAQYDSVEAMMSRYAYLGDYWYTGSHPGLGGCYYAEYIYPDGVPSRVTAACSQPDDYCTANNTANCVPTTQEDRDAYTAYQVGIMAKTMERIFG